MLPALKLGSHQVSDLSLWQPQCSYPFCVLTTSSTQTLPVVASLSPTSWKAYLIFLAVYPVMTLNSHPPQICSPSDFLISINGSIIFPTRNWTHSCSMSLHILIISICQLFSTVSCVIFPILILMSLAQDLTSHLILSYS